MASITQRTTIDPVTGKKVTLHWRGQETINGKKVEFTGKTKKIVLKKMEDYKRDLEQYGNILVKENYTLSEWIHRHLFTNKLIEISSGTFQMYKGIYDNYLLNSNIAEIDLADLRQIHIQEFLNSNNHLAYSTLKKFYFLIVQALDKAVDNNLIRKNPAKGIIIPNKSAPKKEIQVLSLSQQQDYILALEGERYKTLFLTALFTGMRIGEIIALKWRHLDLDKRVIHISESIRRVKVYTQEGESNNQLITKAPKTKSGIRTIPIPSFLVELLNRDKPLGDINENYVFETSTGNPQSARNIRKYHDRICKKAKINPIKITKDEKVEIHYQGVSLHALRHTFSTRLIECGESPKMLQVMLGHSDIQTTLNIYTHVLDESKFTSATKQNALFEQLSTKSITN